MRVRNAGQLYRCVWIGPKWGKQATLFITLRPAEGTSADNVLRSIFSSEPNSIIAYPLTRVLFLARKCLKRLDSEEGGQCISHLDILSHLQISIADPFAIFADAFTLTLFNTNLFNYYLIYCYIIHIARILYVPDKLVNIKFPINGTIIHQVHYCEIKFNA